MDHRNMGNPPSRRRDVTYDEDASSFAAQQAEALLARARAEGQLTSDGRLTDTNVEGLSTEAGVEKPGGDPSAPSGGSAETRREAGRPRYTSVEARQEGIARARPPRWRRLVSKIARKAGAWRRQSGRHRSQYQQHLLEVAKRVLQEAARDVRRLISDLRHENDQPDPTSDWADFHDVLMELGDSRVWEIFLRAQGLEGSEAAKTAVADLTAHVARVTEDQVSKESLQVLLLSIDTLLAEIEALDAHLVTRERAEFLKATAERISVQVAAASAAMGASAGADGGGLTSRLIIAGLAGCVASEVVVVLHDWHAQAERRNSLSERGLLAQTYQDLVGQLETLALFVSDVAQGEATPRCDDHVARRAHLQARFLLMYSQLLLAGLKRQNIGFEYSRQLREIMALLHEIGNMIDGKGSWDAVTIESRMAKLLERLTLYRTLIESI
jgi:hypothetical protein